MLKQISFRWKLYITYSIIISSILAVSLYGFYRYNAGLLETNMEESSLDMLEVSMERLADLLSGMDQQLRFFQTLPEFEASAEMIQSQDGMDNYFVNHPGEAIKIQQMFQSILVTEPYDSAISYVSKNYNNIHASVSGGYEKSISNQELRGKVDLSELNSSEQPFDIIFPHKDYWSNKDKYVISVYRPVKDMFQEYGFLVYDKNIKELGTVLKQNSDEIILIDKRTQRIYSTRTGVGDVVDEETYPLLKPGMRTGFVDTVGDYSYYYSDMPETGWGVLLKKDVGFYTAEKRNLSVAILLIFMFSNILILCLMNFVSLNLALPLRQLKEKLEHQKLNSAVSLDVVTDNDEITMLSGTIENIVNQIYIQNKNLIAAKELALKAHMNAMEAQMNPHFLYNSLSVIGTYGLEKGDMVIPQMCSELSSLLRYSINYNQKEVRLADELNNIKSYLYIMKMRYEHMLNYSWELDPLIEGEMVPKLILQPIVENCFQHGFKSLPSDWVIKIRSRQRDGRWFISVANKGVSVDESRLKLLYHAIGEFKKSPTAETSMAGAEDGKGLGLKNTILRLHICYEGQESFRLFTEDGYTVVEIGGVIRRV